MDLAIPETSLWLIQLYLPQIILNSVAHSPFLLDNFRRRAIFNPSFDQSNLLVFVDLGVPGVSGPTLGSSNISNIPPKLISNTDYVILQQCHAELAQTRASIYLFPPFQLLPEVTLKLTSFGGKGFIIAPLCPSALWFPQLAARCPRRHPLREGYSLSQWTS